MLRRTLRWIRDAPHRLFHRIWRERFAEFAIDGVEPEIVKITALCSCEWRRAGELEEVSFLSDGTVYCDRDPHGKFDDTSRYW